MVSLASTPERAERPVFILLAAAPDPPGPLWAARLGGASASNLVAQTCTNSHSVRDCHRNQQNTFFHQNLEKTKPEHGRLKPKASTRSPKASPAGPTEPQSAPKCSPGLSYFNLFVNILCEVGPSFLRAGSGIELSAQSDPPDNQNH